MFQVSLTMVARDRRSDEVVRALRSILSAAETDRGFVASRIYQEVGKPETLCLQEDWSSEPALKSHILSTSFTELLRLMETAEEEPILEVRSVPQVYGLEYIEAVRLGTS